MVRSSCIWLAVFTLGCSGIAFGAPPSRGPAAKAIRESDAPVRAVKLSVDGSGQLTGQLKLPLELPAVGQRGVRYFYLQPNGGAPVKFHLAYHEGATTQHAVSEGRHIIHGVLTNVGMDWTAPKPTDHKLFHAIGSLDRKTGEAVLTVFRNAERSRP